MRVSVRLSDILFAGALLVWTVPALSQAARGPGKIAPAGPAREISAEADSSVDALHYDIAIRLGMDDGALAGRISILLRTLTTTITLHSAQLTIDSLRVNGLEASWSPVGAERIRVDPGRPVASGETLSVDLWYRRLQGVARPSWRDGYYWFSRDSVVGLPASVGYTVSEPSDARFWLPCHDEPWDKVTADLAITVKAGIVPASNGRLVEQRQNGDGTTTWYWQERHPIAPYLLCITASDFAISGMPFVRAAGDTIPLQYYTWRADSAAAARFLPAVRSMMSMLTSRFGPYPFDKYGMTAVAPFGFGGMEHQTITTMHRALMTDSVVVLHELAHQWWGNLVTCATWEDIWLNEGFASYCEALWMESIGGTARRDQYLNTDFADFFNASWEGAIYAPESQGYDLFCSAVYTKAAWVLHTLRGVLGDSLFFRTLLAYRERFAGGNATTDQFRAVVDSVSGLETAWFFQQWIHGRGWPEYACSWRQGTDTLHVTIRQVQRADFWPVFRMPIQLRVSFASGDTVVVVRDSLRTQDFALPMRRTPVALEFDPCNWILKRMAGPITAVPVVPEPAAVALEQNFPNPFNGISDIGYRISEPAQVKLQVFDLLGREVATLVNERKPPGEYSVRFDAGTLASGAYVYRLQAGSVFAVKKLVLVR